LKERVRWAPQDLDADVCSAKWSFEMTPLRCEQGLGHKTVGLADFWLEYARKGRYSVLAFAAAGGDAPKVAKPS